MKMRTNFVTNSSSYSSAEIKIDNPVLLEILQKYKDKGAFIRYDGCDLGFGIGSCEREQKKSDGDATPVAFYWFEPEVAKISFAPEKIEDVAKYIMNVIANERDSKKLKNKDAFLECKKELRSRAKEINKNYVEVSWEASNDSYGDSEPEEDEETSWEFYYQK